MKKAILFLFMLPQLVYSQWIDLREITADLVEEKNWTAFGPGLDGYVYLLEDTGTLHYLSDNWTIATDIVLPNAQEIESFHVIGDDVFFFTKNKKLYQWEDSQTVLVEPNVTTEYLFFNNKKLYLSTPKSTINNLPTLLQLSHQQTPNKWHVQKNDGTEIAYDSQTIKWSYNNKPIEIKSFPSADNLFVTLNGTAYVTKAGKLYAIQTNTSWDKNLDDCTLLNPLQNIQHRGNQYFVNNKHQLIQLQSGGCVQIFPELDQIQWIKSTDNKMFIYNGNELYWMQNELVKIPLSERLSEDVLYDIDVNQGVVNVLSKKNGVSQKKWQDIDNILWSPHLNNKNIVNLNCNQLTNIGKSIFCLSPQYGISRLKGFDYDLYQLPSSNQMIVNWNPVSDSLIYIKTIRNELYSFSPDNGKLTLVNEYKSNWDWVDRGKAAILMEDGGFIKAVTHKRPIFYTNDHHATGENSFLVENNQNDQVPIISVVDNALHNYIIKPTDHSTHQFPIISKLELWHNSNLLYSGKYPFYEKDTLRINKNTGTISMKLSYAFDGKFNEIVTSLVGNKKIYRFDQQIQLPSSSNDIAQYTINTKQSDGEVGQFRTPVIITKQIEESNTLWKWIAAGTIGLIGLVGVWLFYKNKMKSRQIQQLDLHNKLLELEQKSMQLQMNPHFIFNALNGVQGMIALGKNKEARTYINKLSQLMRGMLNHSRAKTITIKDELQLLQNYMEIEQVLHQGKWDFTFDVDATIDRSQRIPPMMVQPFLENAIKHAFKGINYTGEISMKLEQKGLRLICTIEDNGVGLQKNQSKDHESVALQLIQSRLKNLNQKSSLEEFKIINKNGDGKSGVIVHIVIPIVK